MTTTRYGTHRASLTIRDPDGTETLTEQRVAVRVRDGQAVAKKGGLVVATMTDVAEIRDEGQRLTSIVAADGETWQVQKAKCACQS